MSSVDRVREVVAPLVAAADLELYDLDLHGGVLQVLVDRPGGTDIDAISRLSRAVSRALDEHDPIEGSYALEVSSPGIERPLRLEEHYARALGETVKIKTTPSSSGDRRIEGVLEAADHSGITLRTDDGAQRSVRYDDIERARTTFTWGGQPKKGTRA